MNPSRSVGQTGAVDQAAARALTDEAGYPRPNTAWLMVGVLYLAYMVAFVDRQVIAYLVGPIRADLDITDFQFGLITGTAFVLFYATLGIPIGRLADHWNRTRIVSIGVTLWSLMTAACGLAGNFVQLFLARVGVGVGEAALSPSAISMIADSFPRHKRTLPINIYSAGVHAGLGFANIFGGLIVGFLATVGAVSLPLIGQLEVWQMTFMIVGLSGLPLAVLVWFLQEPARHEQLRSAAPVRIRDTFIFMGRRWRVYVPLILGASVSAAASYGMFIWVPSMYERTFEWPSGRIGVLFGSITLLFGTGGLVVSGILTGRLTQAGVGAAHILLMIIAGLGCIPAALLLTAGDSAYWVMGCLAVIVFLLGMPIGLTQAALQVVTPNQMRAQVAAIYLMVVSLIGLGIGPISVPAVTEFIYGDELRIRSGIGIVLTLGCVVSAAILATGIATFRRAEASENLAAGI